LHPDIHQKLSRPDVHPLYFLVLISTIPFKSWYSPTHSHPDMHSNIIILISAITFILIPSLTLSSWYPPSHSHPDMHPRIIILISTITFSPWYPPLHSHPDMHHRILFTISTTTFSSWYLSRTWCLEFLRDY
jgi:hypothetical protein